MALVELERYKTVIGETSSANDGRHEIDLEDASAAVASYTDRDLGVALTTEERVYPYDGSGFLEIDDAAEVTQVRYENGSPLSEELWEAHKDGPALVPYTYLMLPPMRRYSGEMGFRYNLDKAVSRGYFTAAERRVYVTAEWGWATVPADIQRAVIWTAQSYRSMSDTSGGALSSHSVAEVSKSYVFSPSIEQENEDLPARAKAILEKYRRHVL